VLTTTGSAVAIGALAFPNCQTGHAMKFLEKLGPRFADKNCGYSNSLDRISGKPKKIFCQVNIGTFNLCKPFQEKMARISTPFALIHPNRYSGGLSCFSSSVSRSRGIESGGILSFYARSAPAAINIKATKAPSA
jgi:hypothetical protein